MIALTLLTAVLEQALNRYLQLDPETQQRLIALTGNVVKIELSGWNKVFYILLTAEGLRLQNHYSGAVNAAIKGSPFTLLRLSLTPLEQLPSKMNTIEMSGDNELVHTLSHILKHIDIDWEEQLSRVTGDVIAHQIGNTARRVGRWRKRIANDTQLNLSDYLQQETRYLPTRQEMEDFFADSYQLQQDLERFTARLHHCLGMRIKKS